MSQTWNKNAELEFIKRFWLRKLQPYGKRGYCEKKLTRQELLQQISSRSRET